jgi:aminoglycoside 6-adenylyltransferase
VDTEHLLADIVEWTTFEPNVRVAVLTGSTTGQQQNRDRLSDLDIELYVRNPAPLLENTTWWERFGEVLAVESLSNPGWHPTRLVYYVGGKVDFAIAPTRALATAIHTRPFEVLVDKDRLASGLSPVASADNGRPSVAAFMECVNWFYAAALMCAKCVVRDEPWMAKFRDWDLKCQLLRMIEWDHKARYGWSYDTWFNGKHLNRWLDLDVREALEACWSGFAVSETPASLLASFELFDRLTTRTAGAVGVTPPDAAAVRSEVISILRLAISNP